MSTRRRLLHPRAWGLGVWVIPLYVFLLFPSLVVLPISFNGTGQVVFPPVNPSLDLYREFLTSRPWQEAVLQSTRVALLSLSAALLLGIPAAFAADRLGRGPSALVDGLFLGPMLLPTVLIALGTYVVMARLQLIGTTFALVVAHATFIMPFVFVTARAGLRQIPRDAETAAMIMGAGWLRIFVRVTLPQLGRSVASGAILAFLMSFDEVVISYFIAGPLTTTLPVKMFTSIQWEVSPILAAISTLLTLVSIVACAASYWLERPSNEDAA